MTLVQRLSRSMLVAALAVAGGAARAHGDEDHARKAGPMKREQKDWGIAGDAKAAKRTVEFKMSDTMRFTPDTLEVKQGETVKLVLKNNGAVLHEFVLGTKKELEEHAALMVKFPSMEHSEPYMAHVAPGKTGEIIWTFNRAGDFDFACLIAGHYQSGMVGKVKVLAAPPGKRASMAALHWIADAAAPAAGDMTDGEVRKIDIETSRLTLKHGEIKNLDMPSMTMVFVVKDKVLLDKLQPGDKVKFKAVNEGGKFTVTELRRVP